VWSGSHSAPGEAGGRRRHKGTRAIRALCPEEREGVVFTESNHAVPAVAGAPTCGRPPQDGGRSRRGCWPRAAPHPHGDLGPTRACRCQRTVSVRPARARRQRLRMVDQAPGECGVHRRRVPRRDVGHWARPGDRHALADVLEPASGAVGAREHSARVPLLVARQRRAAEPTPPPIRSSGPSASCRRSSAWHLSAEPRRCSSRRPSSASTGCGR
jgi:hypothetical protein